MFERYLTDALTTNFGHFIEGLDAQNVRLSAWKGELVLRDLTLKQNALEHVFGKDCPVELAFGRVGNLELRIPWSLFRSQDKTKFLSTTSPCSIVLSDVNILMTPRKRRRRNDNDEEEDKPEQDEMTMEQRRIQREKLVQSLLDGHLLRRVTESTVSSSSSRWSWVQEWLSTLLSTLSVTVRNIHVRYEDPGTCMGFVWDSNTCQLVNDKTSVPRSIRRYRPAFAVGITLQQFSVESSSDKEEEEKEGEGKDDVKTTTSTNPPVGQTAPYESRRKLAAAERLAIYWDSDCHLMAVHSDTVCLGDKVAMNHSTYYQLAFEAANRFNTTSLPDPTVMSSTVTAGDSSFEHGSLYKQRHSYVLDPISPSVSLTLVSPKDATAAASSHAGKKARRSSHTKLESVYSTDNDSDDSSNDDGSAMVSSVSAATTTGPQPETTTASQIVMTPPSSVRIHLPPCTFTLARSTLEDTAYIRKSLSIWRHATKGILSEATLRRLAKLRPTLPPQQDPQGWWFYAAQATLALSQVNNNSNREGKDKTKAQSSLERSFRRRRGWRGFFEAFQRRKQYVSLYQSLVQQLLLESPSSSAATTAAVGDLDPTMAHQKLLEMEDELLPDEIVAFRLALYETWNATSFVLRAKPQQSPKVGSPTAATTTTTTSSWQLWTTTSASETPQAEDALESDSDILSERHRIAMMVEMTQALERERANVRKSAKEEAVRQASLQSLPVLDHHEDGENQEQSDTEDKAVIWKASVACNEIAIQINDEAISSTKSLKRATPVVRFSCAWVQDQWWYHDDSWDIDCSLSSLLVKDLTQSKAKLSHGYFPNLIARKAVDENTTNVADFVWIDGQRHHKGLSIAVRRRLHWNADRDYEFLSDFDRGSTTETRVRILPMEVVYSTVPVEVATRVLGTVKTPELVDDYHRMAAAAHGWQERQKKKFLAALAHKRKKIIVDVDVGAPELLIPEDINNPESPLLAFDLGRLRIFNDEASMESSLEYDDQWRLVLSNIQVRSATVASFGHYSSTVAASPSFPGSRQIVEPFSLDFAVSTRIASEDSHDPSAQTKVRIFATLPRLAFNLNSSSIRLVSRLQSQWQRRRRQAKAPIPPVPSTVIIEKDKQLGTTESRQAPAFSNQGAARSKPPQGQTSTSRVVKFEFTAPVISLRLDNDTEDIKRPIERPKMDVPLLDLAFRGIRGSVVQEAAPTGVSSTVFDARLHSLGAIDLVQTAGRDFALLMASAPPEYLNGLVVDGKTYAWASGDIGKSELWSGKDLVTIQYSSTTAKDADDSTIPDKLSIGFHELYVEWNPETFASIQESIRIPSEESDLPLTYFEAQESDPVSDDEFFDAVEAVSIDSYPDETSFRLVSEVASSSFETAEADLKTPLLARQSSIGSGALSLGIQHSLSSIGTAGLSPPRMVHSSVIPLSPHQSSYPIQSPGTEKLEPRGKAVSQTLPSKGFEVAFELSKLRVSFNKESRHRKVIIAQMDGTSISYTTMALGGSKTKMNIGNLVWTDPATSENSTLYGQILGLKTKTHKSTGDELSSLLEMEILINPRTRTFESGLNLSDDDPARPVKIDRVQGVATGCNYFVQAKFSPMRFVFLEQLWFEFIDYFFEGILGNAVWGSKTSAAPASPVAEYGQELLRGSRFLPGSDANGFNFTRFNIQLESPELLFPVTYNSPHFLRLDLGGIHVTNKYDGTLIDGNGSSEELGARMQWFNNCAIVMSDLRLFSWNGKELGQNAVVANVALRWPTGPSAPLVSPKWRVKCSFDSLDITLRRADYALIQHIITYNIGEQSRHLNEWHALQKLSPADFLAYTESILVHYGYDQKDVTPTTYDLRVSIPCVSAKFVDSVNKPIAVARCIDLVWSLRKDSDLISKQKATFDINLEAPSSSSSMEKLLSSWKYDQATLLEDFESDENEEIPELTYTSTTLPCGDNTKELEIVDACIYADIPAWRNFVDFFSSLPEPALFEESEITTSIQVGDRWYRIGGEAPKDSASSAVKDTEKGLDWIKTFNFSLNGSSVKHMHRSLQTSNAPTFQMRVSLTSPRIILSSDPMEGVVSRLVLRMSHLDLLHVNSGIDYAVMRSFLLDEVEVYTLSGTLKRRKREGENSLIHPWSVGGIMEKCNGQNVGNCKEHVVRISADVLQARASYSDMAVAIEVCLSVAHSASDEGHLQISKSSSSGSIPNSSFSTGPELTPHIAVDPEADEGKFCSGPDFSLFDVECDGFELLVADDSGRHFATNQDLIILSLGKVLFSHRERRGKPSRMHLRLHGFDLFDCLQPADSPFRTAASTRPGTTRMSWNSNDAANEMPDDSFEQRKYDWNECKIQSLGDSKFEVAAGLVQRLTLSTERCSSMQDNHDRYVQLPLKVIEVSRSTTAMMQQYQVKLRSLSVQWNPSTVIAIQRFLGRLRKESKSKIVQVFHSDMDDLIAGRSKDFGDHGIVSPTSSGIQQSMSAEATIELDLLEIMLNKEHQNRRLLEMTLSNCRLELDSTDRGMTLSGSVGTLSAWDSDSYPDGIQTENRHVVKILKSGHESDSPPSEFLRLTYKTFKSPQDSLDINALPNWVQTHISEIGGIDDFLSVRVAATEFCYLKERTEELIDYLSNGLPGKGMGVTSRAAKGFISKRILTKSFLEFQNDSPQVFVPQHESSSNGVALELGDVMVRSYFEKDTPPRLGANENWWRILALDLSGFQVGIRENDSFAAVTNSIDLGIYLRKPTSKGGELSLRGKLSFVDLVLRYTDYSLIRCVADDNVGRKIDTDKWDNIEKAYWSEEVDGENATVTGSEEGQIKLIENRVEYSSNARFVRYGKAGKRKLKIEKKGSIDSKEEDLSPSKSSEGGGSSIDLKFVLDGLSLKLTRDDTPDGIGEEDLASAFCYDIILLRVQIVEISMTTSETGEVSFHLSLFRLGLFDLGDGGRLVRERYYAALLRGSPNSTRSTRKGPRRPCPFQVIAEGYIPGEDENGIDVVNGKQDGPQLVVTVDRGSTTSAGKIGTFETLELPADAKFTTARVVVNYLSVNVLIRPLKEALAFFGCDWPIHGRQLRAAIQESTETGKLKPILSSHPPPKLARSEGFQLKLVAHYPRVFFLADESDDHTRALVLRGLAVVNMSKTTKVEDEDVQRVLSADAQLQSMESYINADVHQALCFKASHLAMVGEVNAHSFPEPEDDDVAETGNSLGVALIQPVTAGLEFSETNRVLFPTKRSVFVNIEPVSTMLSFEDLNLIETVLKRFSSTNSGQNTHEQNGDKSLSIPSDVSIFPASSLSPMGQRNQTGVDEFEVTFRTQRLGLGLKTTGGKTVLNSIQNTDNDEIEVGDVLVSIEGDSCFGLSLDIVVDRLSTSKRPITLRFARQKQTFHPSWKSDVQRKPSTHSKGSKKNESMGVSSFSVSPFTVNFKKGAPSGIVLERSICGRFPVVMKVLPTLAVAVPEHCVDESNAEQIEALLEKPTIRVPRPGAVVVAVNEQSIQEVGVEEIWTQISKMSATGDLASEEIYSMSFLEIDSDLWGKVESVDVSSSGFALSFIDDLHGRDMPLFRGKLNALEIHGERGIGGRAQIIEVELSSVLKLEPNSSDANGPCLTLTRAEVDNLKSETVITLSAIAICSVDYFHPRIAFWEPLIEPSQLFVLVEKQAGSQTSNRPGQVAVELSDRLLREQSFRENMVPSMGASPQMVIFNLTDSSAQVAVKAISQFKEWRKTKASTMDDNDEHDEFQFGDNEIELRESNPLPDDAAVTTPANLVQVEAGDLFLGSPRFESVDERMTSPRDAKRDAAQRAAQAALVFAQKRGAESSKTSDSAKPFVLRNRTGVSIAFVPSDSCSRASSNDLANESYLSVVGEYAGLGDFDPLSIKELADKEDAKFSLEIISETSRGNADAPAQSHAAFNKVRNYEGRFPSLTIAIQAVSGVFIEPLTGLQVFKVGSTVRHLLVRKEVERASDKSDLTEYSIPVVWKVEIEDNRRVLTLSTAVRVVTTAFATPVEIGVQKMIYDKPVVQMMTSSQAIRSIGIAQPDCPFYLPLWVALKLEAVNIFVRPRAEGGARYEWGRSSVLRFAPLLPSYEESVGTWVWEETFEELDYIRCDAIAEGGQPIWLAVFSGSSSNSNEQFVGSTKRRVSTLKYEEEHHEVISVTLDSNVTLRNMLPMSIDWQVAHFTHGSASLSIVDGSPIRSVANTASDDPSSPINASLHSGECTEVFACDYDSAPLQARFREPGGLNWSAWAPLALEEVEDSGDQEIEEEDDSNVPSLFPRTRQVNVQATNDSFGVPLTFGVRIVPKMTLGTLDEPTRTQIYGIEIIVYAELWIRNITALPLNFGCPSYQLHGSATSPAEIFDDSATRFNAESALMEIASLLEVGDKATGLDKKAAREVATTGAIQSLPNQECDELWEEVFEYLEIEFSTVKRRWWASESYDSFRMNITQSLENGRWNWIGDNWSIDTAGDVNASLGGWESSRNLLAGAGSFNGSRTFDSSHSIRRRRYFRNRTGYRAMKNSYGQLASRSVIATAPGSLHGGLQAFHQPLKDSFTREQRNMLRKKKRRKNGGGSSGESDSGADGEVLMKIAVKCADGKWSMPATIPDSGTSHGVLRVLASRWPSLTTAHRGSDSDLRKFGSAERRGLSDMISPFGYRPADLSPGLHELCYTVSDVEGEWGEFSRAMVVSPRFMVRNDSTRMSIEVKQAGTPDATSLKLPPGAVEAFYWQDFRLPGLVCVSPCVTNDEGRSIYKWSGGFDICNLGMVPLRIRREITEQDCPNAPIVRSMRALVEIRPGTGGFGITVSFREEDPLGDGSLFRIENLSPFPIWLSQDGMLANPKNFLGQKSLSTSVSSSFGADTESTFVEDYEANGDLIRPGEKFAFALDVPYRQGKYAHRKEATLKELLRVRIALAPLAHRAGIETVKVIGLTDVGESIRMNPSKLFGILDDQMRTRIQGMRLLAVVVSDGPTRVLKVILVRIADDDVFGNTFREVSYMASKQNLPNEQGLLSPRHQRFIAEIRESATSAFSLYANGQIPEEDNARKDALYAELEKVAEATMERHATNGGSEMDQIYSVRAEFSGFLFSLVDSAPSEIAVATLRNFNVLGRWNGLRTKEASLILSVGWLQVDNHVPSAPFKVAVRPDTARRTPLDDADSSKGDSEDEAASSPLLMVAIAFAPKHNSGIVCLRSVTVAPRNLVVAVDLAFLVRLQRFFVGLKNHFQGGPSDDVSANAGAMLMYAEQKRNIPFPNFQKADEAMQRAAAIGTASQKLYFQGLTILPAAITLSVAPARALTPTEAGLEGKEVAAIHQAVRKGDVLVGSSSALLGVRVGRKNTTPLAVVRGVFKSIVVDALLRLDGASLNFSGVFLRNHISSGPQLSTYLLAHYLASLRQNVPALLGSLAAFGNPLGLIRGLGDGMSDFVSQPVRGLKKSVQELDPTYLVDGVARGTESLARHAVGGFADSASLLTETFSKNMAVLTLDRRYAQNRDRSKQLRLNAGTTVTLAGGVESGFVKLVQGFMEGVMGVVKAPMRGAEKKGIEGFAKGVGKGLLGLLVKPIIGISDAATDVMIGVKNSMEATNGGQQQNLTLIRNQFRPRRPMYGRDKVLRPYKLEDAAAAALMLRTRCAGENYLSHLDLGDRVALLSVKRFILLGSKGQELMALKYKHVERAEVRQIPNEDNSIGWAIIIVLNTPRKNGSEVEVLSCASREEAVELCSHLQRGIDLIATDRTAY